MHSTALRHKIKTGEDSQGCSSLQCFMCDDVQTHQVLQHKPEAGDIGSKAQWT